MIVHTVPEYFPAWAGEERGKRIVGYATWETDRLPPTWPGLLRSVEALVVPCTWNAEIFRRDSGLERMGVVPHPCDPTPLPEASRAAGEFCFYAVGDWSTRKGITATVRAFCRAFDRHDAVRLVVKTTRTCLERRRWPWAAA